MLKRLRNFLRSELRRSVIYHYARNPAVRVDPSAFPDDEFPVVCLDCGYQLRGVIEGVCPECGAHFDRGRLLVMEYMLESGARLGSWSSRRIAWLVMAMSFFCLWALILAVGVGVSSINQYSLRLKLALLTMFVLLGVYFASCAYLVYSTLRNRQKARAIFEKLKLPNEQPCREREEDLLKRTNQ